MTDDPDENALRLMTRVAQEAGALLLDRFETVKSIPRTEKTAGDFVSDADLTAETTIRDRLQTAHPGIGWLGEETGASGDPAGLRWIVDPLDGTTNFLHGLPHWAVSIALAEGDRVIAGVVHDPVKAETFTAGAGTGAYLNGAPIHVSQGVPLSHALLATGVPAGGRVTYLSHSMHDIEGLMPDCAGIRRWGAATLDLAYVAAGRIDAYWERNLGPWDVAAGLLLVAEAGGEVRPLWPGRSVLETGSFLASNADLGPLLAPRLCDARDSA
ncbi:MAG: inositol monophosphatase family protein [Roseovarius sp.]|jgi:myo-inositol-1(or 4)-monophosphatase|uniref:inositol monophosphatase family protein n=1 Tax=Roseovarius sp. TaxID=1486281 RepID=UPI0032EECD89